MANAIANGPPAHGIAGHYAEFAADRLGFMTRCAREYGDWVLLRFGPLRAVLVSDPAAVEAILVTRRHSFVMPRQQQRARPLFGNGLTISEGPHWLQQRRRMQPAFNHEHVSTYGDSIVRFAASRVTAWVDRDVDDLFGEVAELSLDLTLDILFGTELSGADITRVHGAVTTATTELQARLNAALTVPAFVPTPANRRLAQAIARLDQLAYRLISLRRATAAPRADVLSLLVDAVDEDGSRMTDVEVRDEVMNLLVAGHDTSAATMTWSLVLLAHHPAEAAKVEAEVDGVIGSRTPATADAFTMPALEAVIYEALRLYPPVYILGRDAKEDVDIGGRIIRAGTLVIIPASVLHRDSRQFERPDEFVPDRWRDGLAKRLPRGGYIPFAVGPRKCLGADLAMLEMSLILATIIQRTRLTLLDRSEIVPAFGLTMRPGSPIRAHFHRRSLGNHSVAETGWGGLWGSNP